MKLDYQSRADTDEVPPNVRLAAAGGLLFCCAGFALFGFFAVVALHGSVTLSSVMLPFVILCGAGVLGCAREFINPGRPRVTPCERRDTPPPPSERSLPN